MWQSGMMWQSGRARLASTDQKVLHARTDPRGDVSTVPCEYPHLLCRANRLPIRPMARFRAQTGAFTSSRLGHDLAKCSRVSLQRNWIANLSDVACDFLRSADDCNVYIRGEQAGRRIMTSLIRFIEGTSNARVDVPKSAVTRPERRNCRGPRSTAAMAPSRIGPDRAIAAEPIAAPSGGMLRLQSVERFGFAGRSDFRDTWLVGSCPQSADSSFPRQRRSRAARSNAKYQISVKG